MPLTLEANGLSALAAGLAAFEMHAAIEGAMEGGVALVEDEMRARTPNGTFRTVAPSSGELQRSVAHTPPAWSGAVLSSVVGPTKPYGYWINYGQYAGGRPGLRTLGPERFVENAADAARPRILALFAAAIAGAFRR